MGQGSKKKKKSGKRNKGRTPSKVQADADNELLSDEITALCAIFQEDCKIASESPPQITIKLRPYSKDMGFEDLDLSAVLSVRCLPGYPYKCPKLLVTPEKGLSQADADRLLPVLHDQANFNAREGRVMIFNLVEAAQEFLSAIVPVSQVDKSDIAGSSGKMGSSKGPFVYGFIDLFGAVEEAWDWGLGSGMDNNSEKSTLEPHIGSGSKLAPVSIEKKPSEVTKPRVMQDHKPAPVDKKSPDFDMFDEESEDDHESIFSSVPSKETKEELVEDSSIGYEEDTFSEGSVDGDEDDYDPMHSHQSSHISEKDLIMAHLLHLACASKGQLADALPHIASELQSLGILTKQAEDYALKPSLQFRKAFDHAFKRQITSSRISHFWNPASDMGHQNASVPSSRYLNDFQELQSLGHGGFGHVVLCKNKLDGRQYAVKKIRLRDKRLPLNDRILREVATLSRLQHQHVVRYYQAWFETGIAGMEGDAAWGSMTAASSPFNDINASSVDVFGQENKLESTYLYIQMEYCPRTLRQVFESYQFDKELAWHLFRQIVEGLAHIHGQGIIHRDLTPSNIFFDARNDIKIGDFGLAKFLKFEQLDQDSNFFNETTRVSTDGTGQVGTYFYTAPEIEQGWPKIDEKADMYSLGVVFFELWHPFGTAMERHIMLSDLKQKRSLPAAWVAEFPEQASLLRCLMSPSPSDRPSATELLQHAFPPRMEYELLDNMLRTMRVSEDTSVYDKVVNAIFDEEAFKMKDHHQHAERSKLNGDIGSNQDPEFDGELRDHVVAVTREVFRQHCGKNLEISPMHLLDDSAQYIRKNTVKLLTRGGDMLELCHELRVPFVRWVVMKQKSSFKRYEISYVYRRAVGHSPPNRYLQGDFDMIGGASALTEAEVIKVTMDVVTHFFPLQSCDIHLNHGYLLDAIWSWIGIKAEQRQKTAELVSLLGSLRPQSSEWKSGWDVIRRQLLQELKLAEAVVNRLQTVRVRFCGMADNALPRLRGALPPDKSIHKALDELSDLVSYLRVWKIEKHVYINALMPPSESYHQDLFFQLYLTRESNPGSLLEGALLALGGRYDSLLLQLGQHEYKTTPPGGVGVSLALETILQHPFVEVKPFRNQAGSNVLVCSRGGGGLLVERMELVAELWEEGIKAEFVPLPDPSLTEQYEYANEQDIKCLVIITDTSVSQTDSVKVRHIELKKEKKVERENLIKFLLDAIATQFRNPLMWN